MCVVHHDMMKYFEKTKKNTTTLLEEFFQISKHVGNGFVRRESRISDGKSEVKVGRSSTREPRWKWKQTHSVLIWMLLGYGHSIPAPTSVLRNPGLFSTRNRWTLQVSWDCGIRAAIIFEMFLLSRLKNLYFSVSSYRLMTIGWYSGQVFYSKYIETLAQLVRRYMGQRIYNCTATVVTVATCKIYRIYWTLTSACFDANVFRSPKCFKRQESSLKPIRIERKCPPTM